MSVVRRTWVVTSLGNLHHSVIYREEEAWEHAQARGDTWHDTYEEAVAARDAKLRELSEASA